MKTLYLLRHAKSSWDDPTLGDHERPLNARGRDDATQMARVIATLVPPPELVLCSTSKRTRQTLKLATKHMTPPPVEYRERLYLASMQTLLATIQGIDDWQQSVMLVGHNDGFHDIACLLAGSGPPDALQRLFQKLPTCALVHFKFDLPNWHSIAPGTGELIRFLTPRLIED
jgi:phosphohistidine phosphatase